MQDSDQESPVKKSIARKKRRRTIQDDDNEELELEQVEKVIILSYEALRNEIGEEDVKVKVKDEVNKGRKKPSKKGKKHSLLKVPDAKKQVLFFR